MRHIRLASTLLLMAAVAAFAAPAWAKPKAKSATQQAQEALGSAEAGDYGTVAVAPTEDQARAAYDAARKSYLGSVAGQVPATAAEGVTETDQTMATGVAVGGAPAPKAVSGTGAPLAEDAIPGKGATNVALDDVQLVMDVNNVTLRDVMANVVKQAAAYTGPWTVRWRLKEDNTSILEERVNLTAEARFGEFCDLMTEKIKNLTGVQLFVTAFPSARVILVTDTYY